MRTKRLFVLIHIRNKGEVGTIKLVLALQKTIGLFLGLSSLALLYVMFFLSLSHVVSCVRCGTWLYRFLIFAFLLTLLTNELMASGMKFIYMYLLSPLYEPIRVKESIPSC